MQRQIQEILHQGEHCYKHAPQTQIKKERQKSLERSDAVSEEAVDNACRCMSNKKRGDKEGEEGCEEIRLEDKTWRTVETRDKQGMEMHRRVEQEEQGINCCVRIFEAVGDAHCGKGMLATIFRADAPPLAHG